MQKRPPTLRGRHAARVTTAAQFRALASPVRDQIAQIVVNQAPSAPHRADTPGVSIAEIAAQLGRKPGSLYRHIEELVRVGLIREVGTRESGGRDAATYAAAGEYLFLEMPERSGPALDAMCEYIERMATHAGRECAAAARERGRLARAGIPHDDGSVSMFGWLDDDQRDRLRALMIELAEVFQDAPRRPGTKLIAASLLIRPVRLPGGGVADASQDDAPAGE
jgi:DNA-binding MarR family transcriptional regulator